MFGKRENWKHFQSALLDGFHEKHKNCDKKQIETQIKTMAKYEKRGADTRLKYCLTNEMQVKYGVKVCPYVNRVYKRSWFAKSPPISITFAGCE